MSELITLERRAVELQERNAMEMAAQIEKLAALVISLDARLKSMEKAAQKVTIDSRQHKQLQALIRERAGEVCAKNGITDPRAAAAFKAAIKKDLLAAWGVPDLHDLPVSAWDLAVWAIQNWTKYSLVKKWKYGDVNRRSV
ncbi:MAG: hypothetical protein J6T26_08075 [Firmicutes bacterium]|nr:hypothetical protein [Bacillota bacterium]